MICCSECTKPTDVVTSDPESDDDSVPNTLSNSPHTPRTARSLCFELSSSIVRIMCSDYSIMALALFLAMRILSVRPSVCLTVTHVNCDKTEERSV